MWLQSKIGWGKLRKRMAESKDPGENLSIRCPQCKQRFSVEGDLMDRMVECGACDTRFRINDEVIIRTKKFYPGERGGTALNRFQRVPLSAAAPEGMATMRYAEFKHPEQLEPASPQRILAGLMGVGLMLMIALMLIFASGPGGAFSSMPLENKLVIAGFASLLGVAMLVYANPKARLKAGAFGLLIAAGVVSLPFFLKGQPIAKDNIGETKPRTEEPTFPQDETDPLTDLKARFMTKPLEVEQERLSQAGDGKKAFGIYLTGLLPRNKYLVRDFLIRDTRAGPSSHPYPRDDGDYLMVLTDVPMQLGEVAEIAGRLGQKKEIHEDIGVVVVHVDNAHFIEVSAEKLNTKTDPAFYELNQKELGSIDLDRVRGAVERLADAEPVIYRTDISRIMIDLLAKPGVNFHDVLARALLSWAEDPAPAAEAGLVALKKSVAGGGSVSENLVDLVSRGKSDDAIPTLNLLWTKDPGTWEKYYERFGPPIIPGIMSQLDSESAPLRRSAIRLLGQVGTDEALPALEKLKADEDPEVRILAERAVAAISQR